MNIEELKIKAQIYAAELLMINREIDVVQQFENESLYKERYVAHLNHLSNVIQKTLLQLETEVELQNTEMK